MAHMQPNPMSGNARQQTRELHDVQGIIKEISHKYIVAGHLMQVLCIGVSLNDTQQQDTHHTAPVASMYMPA